MVIWDRFVMFLVAALFSLAQTYGSLGLAIIMLSFSVRLALLPLTLRMARRAQERQAKLLELGPMIHQLRAKYRADPQRLKAELITLYRQHDCSPIDGKGFLGSLIQLPIGAGLYMAIRRGLGSGGNFLWISNLARPDATLALLIGVLTYLVAVLSPSAPPQARIIVALLPALLTVYVAWNLASGVGLYWATSATVDLVQSALLRRHSR